MHWPNRSTTTVRFVTAILTAVGAESALAQATPAAMPAIGTPAASPDTGTRWVLQLGDALDTADRSAHANRVQRALVKAERGASLLPLRGVLPAVRLDAGFMRTTDPIGAFGTSLRQRVISQPDFDPNRLNHPPVAQNYTGAVVLEQPIFNADALVARRAAIRSSEAAMASAEWSSLGTRIDVIRAYYGAVLATERVVTLQAALRAAQAHVKQAEQMAKNGLVTPSDALLASVKSGEVETLLLEAEGDVANAQLGLAMLLGTPGNTNWQLPTALPATQVVRSLALEALAAVRSDARADLAAARARAEAAQSDALRARSLYLPRLNGFARYDWNSAQRPYAGESNWTVGVMASWSPFAGATHLSDLEATTGRREAAVAMREAAEARALLEVQQSATTLLTALARLDIAERTVRHGIDAHRIVSRKYSGGLAPVVELLDASAIEMQAHLGHAAARYQLLVATAERRKALGHDPAAMRTLDRAPLVARALRQPSN